MFGFKENKWELVQALIDSTADKINKEIKEKQVPPGKVHFFNGDELVGAADLSGKVAIPVDVTKAVANGDLDIKGNIGARNSLEVIATGRVTSESAGYTPSIKAGKGVSLKDQTGPVESAGGSVDIKGHSTGTVTSHGRVNIGGDSYAEILGGEDINVAGKITKTAFAKRDIKAKSIIISDGLDNRNGYTVIAGRNIKSEEIKSNVSAEHGYVKAESIDPNVTILSPMVYMPKMEVDPEIKAYSSVVKPEFIKKEAFKNFVPPELYKTNSHVDRALSGGADKIRARQH